MIDAHIVDRYTFYYNNIQNTFNYNIYRSQTYIYIIIAQSFNFLHFALNILYFCTFIMINLTSTTENVCHIVRIYISMCIGQL